MAGYIDSINPLSPISSEDPADFPAEMRIFKGYVQDSFPNVGGEVSATHTELNVVDGVTATTAELNILDGVTATTAELNILDGVTATTAELNILDGVTADKDEINLLDGITQSLANDGYQKLTGGLIIQWGIEATVAYNVSGQSVVFPLEFPNALFTLTFNSGIGGSASEWLQTVGDASSVTGFDFSAHTNKTSGTYNLHWLALGY